MEILGRAQGRWRLRHSRKVKEAMFWSHGVRNWGSRGKRQEQCYNLIFLFYFSLHWLQEPCYMTAINYSIAHVLFQHHKVYLSFQEEAKD